MAYVADASYLSMITANNKEIQQCSVKKQGDKWQSFLENNFINCDKTPCNQNKYTRYYFKNYKIRP
jgi:hypothetical protein